MRAFFERLGVRSIQDMKTKIILSIICAFVAGAQASDFVLNDGTALVAARVLRATGSSVTLKHSKGIATYSLNDFSPATRQHHFLEPIPVHKHNPGHILFPGAGLGLRLPDGFSRMQLPKWGRGPDFVTWSFTNSVGSRLTFATGGHWGRKGKKTDFKGFAALEHRTNLVRRIVFHSAQFSHGELKKHKCAPPDYSHLLEYKAANPEDETRLNQALESLFLKKEESNKPGGR